MEESKESIMARNVYRLLEYNMEHEKDTRRQEKVYTNYFTKSFVNEKFTKRHRHTLCASSARLNLKF